MGIYIGYIEKKETNFSSFYNFELLAEMRGSHLYELSMEDKEDLLPESEKRDINLHYSWNNGSDRERMERLFPEKALIAMKFELEELDDNWKPNQEGKERKESGYKVTALDWFDKGKICPISKVGVYHILSENEIPDFLNDPIVELDSHIRYIAEGNEVFVKREDGFLAGPYEVRYRDYTDSYYIKPQIQEKKYIISGYDVSDVVLRELVVEGRFWDPTDDKWSVIVPKQGALAEQKDVISKDALLNSLYESLQSDIVSDGKIKLDDVSTVLKNYEDCVLSGTDLPEGIRKNRLNRLVDILTSEKDIDETLHIITDFICDLLIKYQDSENVEEWLQVLLEKRPDLLEQLKSSRAISEKKEEIEEELQILQQQRDNLEQELTQKLEEATNIKNDEGKRDQLYKMDSDYQQLLAKIKEAEEKLGVFESIFELKKKQAEWEDEIAYLERHKKHLENDTSGLELQFQQLISHPHEKMVGIAFDGYMSSKMLHAAAEWEAEESLREYEDLTNKVNAIETVEKTTEELIDYLCRTIQKARPKYSRNTIVNIAICITQGFLTVFSGEPGCGKTSICNIFGEVLGLNQVSKHIDASTNTNRYVPVSVERGWTSKRDFVGYYNPLSKTFDKSNRKVYDALHQLDTEKRCGLSKLPFLVLLDEANLSPMEYYWSDFMNICDDLNEQSVVNLGENYVFGIPETLHFLATINNDHTTEVLSPRLIDRSWIISLPYQYEDTYEDKKIPSDSIEIITWESMKKAFAPKYDVQMSPNIKRIYDEILTKMRERRFAISPRIDKAIKSYWAAASQCFESDGAGTDSGHIALDYAIAQKVLPKIVGNGDSFEKWLEELKSICSKNELTLSVTLLKGILERGNQQMKYYQFFC